MRVTSRVIKEKYKIVVKLDNLEELNGLEIRKLIPEHAKSIELEYNDVKKILIIDYLSKLEYIEEK